MQASNRSPQHEQVISAVLVGYRKKADAPSPQALVREDFVTENSAAKSVIHECLIMTHIETECVTHLETECVAILILQCC